MNRQKQFLPQLLSIVFLFSFLGIGLYKNSIMRADMAKPIEKPIRSLLEQGEVLKNCRYGAATLSHLDFPFLTELGVGWVLNFGVSFNLNLPEGIDYAPVIRMNGRSTVTGEPLAEVEFEIPLTDSSGGLGPMVAAHPGELWLVGNEVDRVYIQDDVMPDVYAKAYHDVYHFIKQRDPSAQIAISGLVEVTPGRLQYLDLVWQSYLDRYGVPMPVDVWNMHVYILPEKKADGSPSRAAIANGTDPALAILESDLTPNQCHLANVYCYAEHDNMNIFAGQVIAMRQWMKAHGQQNKPLILSEFSLLYPYLPENGGCYLQDENGNCFTPERVSQFMVNAFNYLETAVDPNLGYPMDDNRLVQSWLWYAVNELVEGSSNRLVETDYSGLTLMGTTYQNQVALRPLFVNLLPDNAHPVVGTTITPNNTTNVTLTLTLRNNGTTAINNPFTITFYADSSLSTPIGSTTITTPVNGCTTHLYTTSIVWKNLSPGTHPYWVKIDSTQVITENNETDNVISGIVLIDPAFTYLPIISR